jgi:hypothetical protein
MSDQPQQSKTSALAIVALVFTLLCMPLVGFILGIIALIRINKSNGALKGTVVAALAIGLAVPMCGVGSAIAIPSFVGYGCKSKQSEAKANLKALWVAEESWKGEHGSYSRDTNAMGFAPGGGRYELHVLEAGPSTFRAEARGLHDMDGDLWSVDQAGQPKAVGDKCHGGD